MACPYHRNLCAFPDWSVERCEYCHCDWSKITAPATRITTRQTLSKDGELTTSEDVAYLPGYGETPLSHLWRHATDDARIALYEANRTTPRRKREAA